MSKCLLNHHCCHHCLIPPENWFHKTQVLDRATALRDSSASFEQIIMTYYLSKNVR